MRPCLAVAAAALLVPAGVAGAAPRKAVPLAAPWSGPATGKLAGLPEPQALPPGMRPPAGYTIVQSPLLGSPPGTQERGVAVCPGRRVAIGGAAFVASTDVVANVNSSFPTEHAWVADVNNASGAPTQFQVIAICARRPQGYALVTSVDQPNPVGAQSTAIALCPAGTAPLGGGAASSSFDTAVNINSSFPLGVQAAWRADENNASGTAAILESVVVCGILKGYTLVQGDEFVNVAGTQTFTLADCPAPTVPVSAGVLSHSADLRANLNGMRPELSSWEVFVNNASPFDVSDTAFAVCAGR